MSKVTVEYMCSPEGLHDAPFQSCIETSKRTFNGLIEAIPFIESCTKVLNLDDLFNAVPLELMPDVEVELFNELQKSSGKETNLIPLSM